MLASLFEKKTTTKKKKHIKCGFMWREGVNYPCQLLSTQGTHFKYTQQTLLFLCCNSVVAVHRAADYEASENIQ